MQDRITLGQILGGELVDNFEDFDLTQVQQTLAGLAADSAIDIAHAEMLQQKTLYAAELLIEYIAKLVKTVSFLETKLNSVKNKTSLEYKTVDGSRTTADMKKQAGEASPEVEKIGVLLAKAKGSKTLLERKYEILIKSHHYYKDIGIGMRKGIVSTNNNTDIGWK
jgi:hypothetical protein